MPRTIRAFTMDTAVQLRLDQLATRGPESAELRTLFRVTQPLYNPCEPDSFGLYASDYDGLYDLIGVPKHARMPGPEHYKRLHARYYTKPTDAVTAQLNGYIRKCVQDNKTKSTKLLRIANASRVVEALLILGLNTLTELHQGAGGHCDLSEESKGTGLRKNRDAGKAAGKRLNAGARKAPQIDAGDRAAIGAA